ncbi:MAG: hypothetical protein ABJF65_00150 [Reichenbachiella sp.]|uniref:hypothetical protein n=1 Tax=Reichenbachiella sp. TaxID=2184521 RepID=UPI0032677B91
MSHTIRSLSNRGEIAKLQFGASNRNMAAMAYTVLDAIEFDAGVSGNGLDKIYSKDQIQTALKGVEYFKDEEFGSYRLRKGDSDSEAFLNKVADGMFGKVNVIVQEPELETKESCASRCHNFLSTIMKSMSSEYVTIEFR